ncbi:MAG TPA: transglutaminase family protein, partial [Bryobacteraceae bacterium]|nr:transglutaminase family protein [Bryobacteraceae bacterium]
MEAIVTQQLLDLLGHKPSELELDRAALELARIEYPELDTNHYLGLLDRHAFEIANRARDLSDGESFVETANAYLFGELNLRGNNENYYDPGNSFLNC